MTEPKYLHLCFEPLAGTDRRINTYEQATGEYGKVCEGYEFKQASSPSPLCLRIDTNSPIEQEVRCRLIDAMHPKAPDPAPKPDAKPGERRAAVDYRDMPPAPPPPETEAEAMDALLIAGAKLMEGRRRMEAGVNAEATKNPALRHEMDFNRRLDTFMDSPLATTSFLGSTGFFDNYSHYYLADARTVDALENHGLIPKEVGDYFRQALATPLTSETINRLNKDGVLKDEYVTPLKRSVLGLKDTPVTLEPVGGLKERVEAKFGRVDDNYNANRLPATSPFCVKLHGDFFVSDRIKSSLEWESPHEREQKLKEEIEANPGLKQEMALKEKFDVFVQTDIAKSSHLSRGGVSLDAVHYYRASPELLDAMDKAGLIVAEDRDKLKAAVTQNPSPASLKSLEESGLLHPKFVEIMAKTSPSPSGHAL